MLTASDKRFFVDHGYLKIPNLVPKHFINEWWGPRESWLRENYSTAPEEHRRSHLYLPRLRTFKVGDWIPDLPRIISDLTGMGVERCEDITWGDGFTVAMPMDNCDRSEPQYWHKDGFFRHFLDTSEVRLTCLVLWSDVTNDNGATELAVGSVEKVARLLLASPRGLEADKFAGLVGPEQATVKATGERGDVFFLHPMLLHRGSFNRTVSPRAITNPSISDTEPLDFNANSPVVNAVTEHVGVDECVSFVRETGGFEKRGDPVCDRISSSRAWLASQLTLSNDS